MEIDDTLITSKVAFHEYHLRMLPLESNTKLVGINKSSKDCTWSAVPDALLGVIS